MRTNHLRFFIGAIKVPANFSGDLFEKPRPGPRNGEWWYQGNLELSSGFESAANVSLSRRKAVSESSPIKRDRRFESTSSTEESCDSQHASP